MNAWASVLTSMERGVECVLRWDQETLLAIHENRLLRPLALLFLAATYLGDGYLWGGLAVGLVLFGRPADHRYVLIGLSISIVNIFVFRAFKMLFRRERPTVTYFALRSRLIDGYSFPSGHATTSFGIVWVIAAAYPHLLLQLGAYLVAITIALSRVYLKEHYPLDVISGAVLGSVTAAYLLPVFQSLLF